MKTNVITITTSKAGLLARYLALLLAAATVAFGSRPVWATDAVPLKGRAEGAIVSSAPDPAGVLLRTFAEGYATQLGRFTREEILILNPVAGSITGTIVFTAANGDQLSGLVAAQFTSATTVIGTVTLTGGTGRFANATGAADAAVTTPDGVHFSVEFAGSVSSVGASKN